MTLAYRPNARAAVFIGALVLIFGALNADLRADQVVLRKGTPIKLRLTSNVSSEVAKIGDPVEFKVAEDVKIDNVVVVPTGNKARGFVANAVSGRIHGAGILTLYVGSVVSPGGFQIPVYGTCETSRDPVEAVIPEGTEATAEVNIDVALEINGPGSTEADDKAGPSDRAKAPPKS